MGAVGLLLVAVEGGLLREGEHFVPAEQVPRRLRDEARRTPLGKLLVLLQLEELVETGRAHVGWLDELRRRPAVARFGVVLLQNFDRAGGLGGDAHVDEVGRQLLRVQ